VHLYRLREKTCQICGKKSELISEAVGVCVQCLRKRPEEALTIISEKHREARTRFSLPPVPPKTRGGIPCKICSNNCIMGEGEKGYCGLRWNREKQLIQLVDRDTALLHYYLDPHITNCCSAWACPAGTEIGFPEFSVKPGAEYGYYNLALFFYGCSFNCLFCQNWTHKLLREAERVSVDELLGVSLSNEKITCWCWFGGSPEPQFPFALNASRRILEEKPEKRVMRICFEWNGSGNQALVKRAGELSLTSGGNIKFDLKAYNPVIHRALTGRPNDQTLRNFELIYREFYEERRSVPVLTATTLLVPHYIDELEVESIARFISALSPEIPYTLLVFHPDFLMKDLPVTPERQVYRCYQAAKKYLKNVNVSNLHLLGYPKNSLTWGLASS